MKLREASSRCIFGPQFCAKALPSYEKCESLSRTYSRCFERGVRTSKVYSCTLAFLCASLLIRAATASFALYPGTHISTDSLQTRTRLTRIPPRQLYRTHPNRSRHQISTPKSDCGRLKCGKAPIQEYIPSSPMSDFRQSPWLIAHKESRQ